MIAFLTVYALIGFVIGLTFIMVHGRRIVTMFDWLSRGSGVEAGPVTILTAMVLMSVAVWPLIIVRFGDK